MDEILLAKANEGDLDAMIQVSRAYFFEMKDIFEAINWARKTVELHDTMIIAYENLCTLLDISGHVSYKIGALDRAMDTLLEALEIIDLLKDNDYYPENIRKIESQASMNCARIATANQDKDLICKFLPRIDKKICPYVVVLKAFVNSENKNSNYMRQEFEELKEVTLASNWADNEEKSFAYYFLATHYLFGTGGEKNIDLAYENMKVAADLGLDLAQKELRRFSKNFLGKITYK